MREAPPFLGLKESNVYETPAFSSYASPRGSELCAELGCRYPIFGLSHSAEVVAAICNAGGVGVWAAARLLPDEIASEAASIRRRVGTGVFGINLMLPRGMPENTDRQALLKQIPLAHRDFVEGLYGKYGVPKEDLLGERNRIVRTGDVFRDQIDSALETPADFFAMAIGSHKDVADRARQKGKRVAALIGSPRHVASALAMKADLIVAQGFDAGGHTGSIGTFTLVPKIVEMAEGVPVLAAGGVGTGRHVLASFALGASGVWLGTLWLGTQEFSMHAGLRQKLINAGCEDTVITRASSGKPMRQIKTSWSDEWASPHAPEPLAMPWQDQLVGSLEGSVDRHSVEALMYSPAGQSVEWVRGIVSVDHIMQRLIREAEEAASEWTGDVKV